MTEEQLQTLVKLNSILVEATNNGLLDELSGFLGYDTVNQFCDVVSEAMKDEGRE